MRKIEPVRGDGPRWPDARKREVVSVAVGADIRVSWYGPKRADPTAKCYVPPGKK